MPGCTPVVTVEERARKIINIWAEKIFPYYREELCNRLQTTGVHECKVLPDVLSDHVVDKSEEKLLRRTGYEPAFVNALAGPDGKNVLRGHVRWLADNCVKKWWRLDKGDRLRMLMISRLGNIGLDANVVVPALIEALKDSNEGVSATAAYVLRENKQFAKVAVPALIDALKNPDEDMRKAAANALGKFRPIAKAAIPALLRALGDPDEDVRWEAAYALGEMGLNDSDIVSALRETARKDSDGTVREGAAEALNKISQKRQTSKQQE